MKKRYLRVRSIDKRNCEKKFEIQKRVPGILWIFGWVPETEGYYDFVSDAERAIKCLAQWYEKRGYEVIIEQMKEI